MKKSLKFTLISATALSASITFGQESTLPDDEIELDPDTYVEVAEKHAPDTTFKGYQLLKKSESALFYRFMLNALNPGQVMKPCEVILEK